MGKQNVIYAKSGLLFSHKEEWHFDTCYNMDLENSMLSEIRQTEGQVLYESTYITWSTWSGQITETG